MVAYNVRPYIVQAIECVLSQKINFPFELVIGEDCSSDGTRQIVYDFQKNYPNVIRIISSDQNVGLRKNYYRVFQASRGKYIAYCDSDDFWQREDKLQIQVDYLESHPECGMVYSDYNWYYTKSGHTIYNFLKITGKSQIYSPKINDIVEKKVDIRTSTVVARRDLEKQLITSDSFLHQGEHFVMGDTQLRAEISCLAEVHYIDESLATYRIREESSTQSLSKIKSLRFVISDSEMYLYLCNKYNLPSHIKDMHENNWRRHSLILAFFEQNKEAAENIRRKSTNLNLKDKLWYWGAKNGVVRAVVLFMYRFRKNKTNSIFTSSPA
jgi:glycosyltransferase involved in cell wall biosynthesis